MDEELKKLMTALMTAHPGPWSKGWTCSDNGQMNDTIEDSNHERIYNGETGYMSNTALNLLLNFPELAKELLACKHPVHMTSGEGSTSDDGSTYMSWRCAACGKSETIRTPPRS